MSVISEASFKSLRHWASAVSKTLLEFSQTRLKETIGIIAVLHTWDQTLKGETWAGLNILVPCRLIELDFRGSDQRSPNSFCTSRRIVKSAISLSGISRVIFASFFAWSISKFRPSAGMPPSWLITFTVASYDA